MQKTKLLLKFLTLLLCALPVAVSAQGGGSRVTVSGTVTSADDNLPLIGVNVIAGPTEGVSTLADGTYKIQVAAGTVLKFQYIGYAPAEFVVPTGSSTLTHNVTLQSDAQKLDDVVVIAYGVRKKGTIAGSVSTVKAEKVENTPTAAFDQALQGQVAGLSVLSTTGEPSVAAKMKIRGTNSINSGTDPLYILDGIAISSNDFNSINPSDIESLTVLKDASSTSIYGARAANGVIVITTKRGRLADRPKITFRTQLGFSQTASNKWNQMNTAERIQYEKEIGLPAPPEGYDQVRKIDVNWFDEVYNSAAFLQNYELGISGATEKTNYYVSGGFYSQEGVALSSGFDRYSFRANIEQRAAKWLKIGTNTMFNYQEIKRAESGDYTLTTPISAAFFMMPYRSPYNADGSLASINDGTWKGTGQNPIEWDRNNPLKYKKYKLISSIFAEATLTEGLTFKSQFGVDYSHTTAFMQSFPSYKPNLGQGIAGRNSNDGINLSVTNTLNYSFRVKDKHSFNFLIGQEGINSTYEAFTLTTRGQTNDKLVNISTATRATQWGDTTDDDYGFVSFFARGEYNYTDRYYADFSVRTDASSRFGPSHKWGTFWSASFMWNMRNEKFMENSRRWLTNAQIAVSTGTSGNSSIPNYEHLALVSGNGNYMDVSGLIPVQPGNPNLGWESLWTTNVALHFGFWNRLDVDLEFYNKVNSDMLMEVPRSYSDNGYGYQWANIGEMVNRGVELNLAGAVISTKNFTWSLNANVSYNKNKITELYHGVTDYEIGTSGTKLVVGHSYGDFFINRYAGVNPANGDALWYTKDGQLTNELRDSDKVMIGKSSVAPWQGGFGTNLAWKGLALSAQFSWVADRWMINNDRFFNESNGRFASNNQSKRLLKRWKNPGDVTDIPRHGVYTEIDSRLLEDASFLRLKNLMLSYSLPESLLKKTRFLAGVKIYAQAQNLLTFTNFSGLDPESDSNVYRAQYPMSRQFTFGLDLTF